MLWLFILIRNAEYKPLGSSQIYHTLYSTMYFIWIQATKHDHCSSSRARVVVHSAMCMVWNKVTVVVTDVSLINIQEPWWWCLYQWVNKFRGVSNIYSLKHSRVLDIYWHFEVPPEMPIHYVEVCLFQANFCTNPDLLYIVPLETKFSDMLIKIQCIWKCLPQDNSIFLFRH